MPSMSDKSPAKPPVKEDRSRFVGFAFASSDLLLEVDDDLIVRYAFGAATELTGKDAKQLLGGTIIDLIVPDERAYAYAVLRRLAAGSRLRPMSIGMNGPAGQRVEAIMGGFHMKDGAYYLSLLKGARLSGLREETAPRDSETDVLDNRSFADRLRTQIAQGKVGEDAKLHLFALDGIDKIRETGDPAIVERFLAELGARLRALSDGGDGAGRLADGRFAVSVSDAEAQAEIRKLQAEMTRKAQELGLGDIGVRRFEIDLDVAGLDDQDAAKALGHAMKTFTNSNLIDGSFDIDNLANAARGYLEDTVQRIASVRQVLDKGLLNIAFQAIVKFEEREAWYYEAMVRLDGFSGPRDMAQFIDSIGIADEFDLLVAEKIIEILTEKAKAGFRPKVAFNVSVKSLASPLFVASLRRLFKAHRPVSKQVGIEINDAADVNNPEKLDAVVQVLREEGMRVAIDGVGRGRTLDILREVGCDYVKLAPEVVRGVYDDEKRQSIVRSLVRSCQGMGYTVVAEGIDLEEDARALMHMDVPYGQGDLFGKPSTGGQSLSYKPAERHIRKRGVNVAW